MSSTSTTSSAASSAAAVPSAASSRAMHTAFTQRLTSPSSSVPSDRKGAVNWRPRSFRNDSCRLSAARLNLSAADQNGLSKPDDQNHSLLFVRAIAEAKDSEPRPGQVVARHSNVLDGISQPLTEEPGVRRRHPARIRRHHREHALMGHQVFGIELGTVTDRPGIVRRRSLPLPWSALRRFYPRGAVRPEASARRGARARHVCRTESGRRHRLSYCRSPATPSPATAVAAAAAASVRFAAQSGPPRQSRVMQSSGTLQVSQRTIVDTSICGMHLGRKNDITM